MDRLVCEFPRLLKTTLIDNAIPLIDQYSTGYHLCFVLFVQRIISEVAKVAGFWETAPTLDKITSKKTTQLSKLLWLLPGNQMSLHQKNE